MEFGKALKRYRESRGWTQQELAQKIQMQQEETMIQAASDIAMANVYSATDRQK